MTCSGLTIHWNRIVPNLYAWHSVAAALILPIDVGGICSSQGCHRVPPPLVTCHTSSNFTKTMHLLASLFNIHQSSVLIMPEKKQMPWLVISKCQVQNLPHHPIPHPSPSHPVFLFCFFAVPGLWATRTKTLNISQSHTRDFTTNPCRWWILLLFVRSELGTKNPATPTKNQNNTIHSVLMQQLCSWNFEVGVAWL